jgi:hypothetical protein
MRSPVSGLLSPVPFVGNNGVERVANFTPARIADDRPSTVDDKDQP